MEKINQIISLEVALGLHFPPSYRQFLQEQGSAVTAGFKVLGMPTEAGAMSVVQATELLRKRRPDLQGRKLVVICFKEESALCLDLDRRNQEDAFLAEVSDITKPGTYRDTIPVFCLTKEAINTNLELAV